MKSIVAKRTVWSEQQKPNKKSYIKRLSSQYQLLILSVPFIALIILFNYVPLWGWIMAFQQYSPGKGIFGSEFVGFEHFAALFQDEMFFLVLRNTLVMSVMSLTTGFFGAILLALLLNEVRSSFFKRTIQTITYIPHFVSWVVIANIVMVTLSPNGGIVNELLIKWGIVSEPILFMSKGEWFWIIHTVSGLWKELGWSTIIYLAVLVGLNQETYEAAEVDGANRFQRMLHISIPGLMPTAVMLLILNTGSLIAGGYESQMLLGNPLVQGYSKVLDLYALDYSFGIGQYSYGVAISMFKSVISILLVLFVNKIAKKFGQAHVF